MPELEKDYDLPLTRGGAGEESNYLNPDLEIVLPREHRFRSADAALPPLRVHAEQR